MSNIEMNEKIEIVKKILKALHDGKDVKTLKEEFKEVLSKISPFEIPIIEQELIKEGMEISEILKLCDLHVELFRDFLQSRELSDVPQGHPIDLLMRENEYILKQAEALNLYANKIEKEIDKEKIKRILSELSKILGELRKIRLHYRKVQMLIYPYLERRGIIAVPRVLWGREDKIIVGLRELYQLFLKAQEDPEEYVKRLANKMKEIANEISELIFRENKILYPATWALLSEGEWAAIHEIANDMGYIIDVKDIWEPKAKPIMPYELKDLEITEEQLKRLPEEFKETLKSIEPDRYEIKSEEDIELSTGFLSKEEIEALFRSLPLEITYANKDARVKFYTESRISGGFVRAKTIVGRRVGFCHPPRLEDFVMRVVKELTERKEDYREYWTKMGDRVIRVMIIAVKNKKGETIGYLETVEDFTEVIKNPEEIMKKIMVL
ncbi:MAG TPA: DUF438 domain-containing protein [Euryarchaeota archaeon]|nr:DUF438 domain-containing protein [Euryarchaeota archaeon]